MRRIGCRDWAARVSFQDRERAAIRAPFDCTVDRVDVVISRAVSTGQEIATVVDLGAEQRAGTQITPSEDTHLAPIGAGDLVLVAGHLTLAHDSPKGGGLGPSFRTWACGFRTTFSESCHGVLCKREL